MIPPLEGQWAPSPSYAASYSQNNPQELLMSTQQQPLTPSAWQSLSSPFALEGASALAQASQTYQQCRQGYAGLLQTNVYASHIHQGSNQTTRCGSEVEGADFCDCSGAPNAVLSTVPSKCGSPQEHCHAYPTTELQGAAVQYNNHTLVSQQLQQQQLQPHQTQQQQLQQIQQQQLQQQQLQQQHIHQQQLQQQFQRQQLHPHIQQPPMQPHHVICMSGTVAVNASSETQPVVSEVPHADIKTYECESVSPSRGAAIDLKSSNKSPDSTRERKNPMYRTNKKPIRKRQQAPLPVVEYPKGNPTEAELALVAQYEPADHIAGVRFSPNKRQWLAAWSVAPGREIRKHFSVVQKGYGEAWKLAVLCRWEAERNGARMRVKADPDCKAITRKRISRHRSSNSNCSSSSSNNARESHKLSPSSNASSGSEDFE